MAEEHETELNYSLEYLLENSDLLIIDSSLKEEESSWYECDIYKSKYFSDMDLSKLQIVEKSSKKYIDLFDYSKVMTVTKVLEQLENWKDKLHDKLVTLNMFQRNRKTSPMYKKQSSKISTRKLRDEDSLQKKLFEKICFNYKEVTRLAKKSIIKLKYPEKFEILEKIVIEVREQTPFEDIRSRYQEPLLIDREHNSADEQIVATALYFSLFENRSSIILTGDSNIARLYYRTTSCMFNQDMHFSDFFIDKIGKDNIIKFFFEINGEIHNSVNSSKIDIKHYWSKLHPQVEKIKDVLFPKIKEYVVKLMRDYDLSHWEAEVNKELDLIDEEESNPYLLS